MKINLTAKILLLAFASSFLHLHSASQQQLKVSDFLLLSGRNGPGITLIGSSITTNGGAVGANKLVQTTGNVTFNNTNIFSEDKIILSNSNVVGGRIAAAANFPNSPLSTGTILSVGSSTSISGDIDVYGNVVIGGGIVSGRVTLPAPSAANNFTNYTYSGPVPGAGPVVYGTPNLPIFPVALPAEFDLTSYPVVTTTITGNYPVGPGNYGNINFSGNKTLTLNRPGIYVFNSIIMTGNSNKLIFNFDNKPGNYFIYIRNNADFGKLNANNTNGGDASRIFLETHGNGSGTSIPNNSFIIANGSSGGGSKWLGSVYASRSGINIGSGTGSSSLSGTFCSSTQITIQSGVTVNYSPFNPCIPPDVTAGIGTTTFTPIDTIPLDFTGHTTLTAVSNTTGTLFSWQATKGGVISTNPNSATITVSAAGTYIVTAYMSDINCASKDTIVVTAKVRNIIGAELLSIYENYDANTANPDLDSFFVTEDGYVKIDVICKVDTQTVINLLTQPQYGLLMQDQNGVRYSNGASKHTITGDFPIINLTKLNLLQDILNFCRPYYKPANNAGLVISQGDTTVRSYLVRKGFNLDGTGIKIGVISDSYNTITDPKKTYQDNCANINQTLNVNTASVDMSEGDVSDVTVLLDFPLKRTDEGRAMMQITDDIAPGSQKYFRTGFFTAGDFAKAIEQLADIGCKIIVDDVTYISEPMLKDGVVAKAVNKVKDQGVSYFSAAGNFANKSYEKNFNPVDATSIGFAGKKAHNFGSDNLNPDFFQKVMLRPGSYMFVFQWVDDIYSADEIAGTQFDMDIYLTRKTDGTELIAFNRDNLFGDPTEYIPINIPALNACDTVAREYNILIVNNTITGDPSRIKYVGFKGGLRIAEYNEGNSTIVGQANAEGAIAVGAARFNHVPGHPLLPSALAGITKPQIESFSSIGGTLVNGSLTPRQKPDLVGPDGVNTTVLMGQDYPNQALDGWSNFFGTSAAAPHVAATAALIIQGRQKFLNLATTPDELKSLLQSTAVDMRPPGLVGYDYTSGAGLVNADAAMRTFASPQPYEIKLDKPANVIPCQEPFTLTIIGENFSDNSIVYLVETPGDSVILTPTYISEGKDTIKVVIATCTGNPEILVYTPPQPPVTEFDDGGFSNSIKLFSKEIVIQTQNVTKKYGQSNPLPATTVTVDGVPIQQTNLTLADVGLDATKLNLIQTNATVYSPVGTYAIKVYRTFDNTNSTDVQLTDTYRYIFKSGLLTIDKMPLKVTPNDITAIYGNYIGNVTYKYEFLQDQPYNTTALRDTAKKYHEAFLPNNALALVKDFKKQQADGSILSDADLVNMNTMVSFNALAHSRKFKIDNNKLVPETDPNNLNSQYIVDIASESIYDFKINPALAKFYSTYAGVTKKAILGEVPLDDYLGQVEVNGTSLQTLINGNAASVLGNSIDRLAPIINGNLVSILDGQLATLNATTGVLEPIANSPKIQYLNSTGIGSLIYLVNGQVMTLAIGGLATLVNGQQLTITQSNSYVIIPNASAALHLTSGATSLQCLINGVESPVVNVSNITTDNNGNLINALSLQPMVNGSIIALNGALGLATLVNATGISQLSPLVNGLSLQPYINNVGIIVTNGVSSLQPLVNTDPGGGGTSPNKTAVIFDETDVNALASNYLGALFGINTITGLDVGVQTLIPAKLANPNFDITYATGKATIQSDQCLLTHGPFKNFGNTTIAPTSLWLNMTTKVSGQLSQNGDFLLFKGGSVTFNNISSTPLINSLDIPDGKIVADNSVSAPITNFDSSNNIWITKVPVGFASSSDIFITGARINSSTGFVKMNGNTNTVVQGRFYCTKPFSDQWAYAIAAYQPQFSYSDIDDPGAVVSINGSYRAGTPLPLLQYLVQGASGGGGNNYTGSSSSFENFTACPESSNTQVSRFVSTNTSNETANEPLKGIVQIYPNPAASHIMVSFVPEQTDNSRIMLFTIDGRMVLEVNNGVTERGILYLRSIDVSKLTKGVYLVQLVSGDKVTSKKIVINR